MAKAPQRDEGVVAERLKDVTCRAAVEWKEQLDSLLIQILVSSMPSKCR